MGESCYDPRIGRITRYARLVNVFGGSIREWKEMKEKDIILYDKVAETMIRKQRITAETNRMSGRG